MCVPDLRCFGECGINRNGRSDSRSPVEQMAFLVATSNLVLYRMELDRHLAARLK